MPTAAWVIATPLGAALVLACLPSWRLSRWLNVLAAAGTFALACRLPGSSAAQGLLLADPLAVHLVLLTSFVGLTAAWFSAFYVVQEAATGRLDRPRLRLYHAMFQAFLGFVLLALLSDNTGVTWVAVEAATIAAVIVVSLPRTAEAIEASWKFFMLCGVAIGLALFGTIVLYLAAAPVMGDGFPAMRWSALALAGPRCNGALLNLAFIFLLIGYGTKAGLAPLHNWMPDAHAEGPTPVSAMLSGAILNVALFVLLRLRGLMQANAQAGMGAIAPGPPLMTLGLLSVLLAAFALWRRRDAKRFFAFSTIEQSGLAAFAFGLGGAAATFAGLLHLTLHTLAKAALFQCVGHAAQLKGGQKFSDITGLLTSHKRLGLTLAAAVLVVAGLPPGGLFASELLIASRTMIQAPWLAVPLGLGLVVGAWGLIERLQGMCLGPASADAGPAPSVAALWPVWLHLALVALLGLAMPLEVAGWLRGIAGFAP
jgi:hydrogenase-4 component F